MCPPAHPLEMTAVGSHVSRDELYQRLSQQASPNSASFNYSNLFALFFPRKGLGSKPGAKYTILGCEVGLVDA